MIVSEACNRLRLTAALLCRGGVPGDDSIGREASTPILDNGVPLSANTRPQRCCAEPRLPVESALLWLLGSTFEGISCCN